MQLQDVVLISRQKYDWITPTPPPPRRPPPPIWFPPFGFELFEKPKKGKKGIKRLRYQPSLVAVAKKLYGRRPRILTGLFVRPII